MKIEDVSGLRRRADIAGQLAAEIASIREQITFASGEQVTYTVGASRDYGDTRGMKLWSYQNNSPPSRLEVCNANPITMRAAILGVLQSELDARLAALEAL